jgi:PTS system ascorbate-specific IIA component
MPARGGCACECNDLRRGDVPRVPGATRGPLLARALRHPWSRFRYHSRNYPTPIMIGILLIAHDTLPQSLIHTVTHVLGMHPPQFEGMSVAARDDPLNLVPRARARLARLDDGSGVLIVSDLYGASPCNLAVKLLDPPRVEGVAGASLPMLIRALTYRDRDMATLVRKAVSGARDGALHLEPIHAAARG